MNKFSKKSVLIVDDVPSMRMMVRSMLKEIGFTLIQEAEDGEHALSVLQEMSKDRAIPCDLIIADWSMPNLPGIELLRILRETFDLSEVHFIMATSKDNEASIQEAARANVTDYLIKPFDVDQLRIKIDDIFSK